MKIWCKRYSVLLSGDLLIAATNDKNRLGQSWASYFRLVVAEYSQSNRLVPWCEYSRPEPDIHPRKRFQFGLPDELATWLDEQTDAMRIDAGTIVRLVLTERLGFEKVAISVQG